MTVLKKTCRYGFEMTMTENKSSSGSCATDYSICLNRSDTCMKYKRTDIAAGKTTYSESYDDSLYFVGIYFAKRNNLCYLCPSKSMF